MVADLKSSTDAKASHKTQSWVTFIHLPSSKPIPMTFILMLSFHPIFALPSVCFHVSSPKLLNGLQWDVISWWLTELYENSVLVRNGVNLTHKLQIELLPSLSKQRAKIKKKHGTLHIKSSVLRKTERILLSTTRRELWAREQVSCWLQSTLASPYQRSPQ
jgi:hypothetical protein